MILERQVSTTLNSFKTLNSLVFCCRNTRKSPENEGESVFEDVNLNILRGTNPYNPLDAGHLTRQLTTLGDTIHNKNKY